MGKPGTPARQTVLKPLGLYSTPNPYGQLPPGALQDATNVVIRKPGVVTSAPAGNNYTPITPSFTALDTVRALAPLNNGHVYSFTQDAATGASFAYEGQVGGTQNTVTTPTLMPTTNLYSNSRVSATLSRSRVLVNTLFGFLVGDFMAPSNSTERALRLAGMPQPVIVDSGHTFTTTGPVPNGVMVGYTAVFTREFSDGYIVKSVPAPQIKWLNNSGNGAQVSLRVDFPFFSGLAAGDFAEIYRTDGVATASVDADPGATYKLVYRATLTNTDIVNGFVTAVDKQTVVSPYYTTSGRELYTNPYQEGSTNANRQPDTAGAQAVFKGFSFYGALEERAQVQLAFPGGIFDYTVMADPNRRANGIGGRSGTGTITVGNSFISSVSAADMVGIVVGQVWDGSTTGAVFPFGTTVIAVTASTIQMSVNATTGAGVSQNWRLNDVFSASGLLAFDISSAARLVQFLGLYYEVTPDRTTGTNFGTLATAGMTVTLEPKLVSGITPGTKTFALKATNGQNYSPTLPALTATALTFSPTTESNLLRWSKDSEPEHVPTVNETRVGSGQIIAMVPTKDALWIACTDGIYRLSGDGGQWRLDIVAPGCVLCAPRCMVNERETIYAYTNYGFGAVTDSGFVPISHNVLRSTFPGVPFSEDPNMIMGVYNAEGEVFIRKFSTDYLYVYNTNTQAFVRITDTTTHLQYITAIALLENPASGSQVPLFGLTEPSVDPALVTWDSSTAQLNMQVTYAPFYADDPLVNKQWIDMSYVFDRSSNIYSIIPGIALVNYAGSVPIVNAQGGSEACANVGVNRTNAIAPKIAPGFSIVGIGATRVNFYGVSVRYVPLTLQAGAR